MNTIKITILLAHALVGWALCAAAMGIGMAVTSLETALVIHDGSLSRFSSAVFH